MLRSDPIIFAPIIFSGDSSIHDGLVDELAEQLFELTLPRSRLRLRHENGDQLLLRIHPEPRAARAAPVVFASGPGSAVQTISPTNREADTKAIARCKGWDRGRPFLD